MFPMPSVSSLPWDRGEMRPRPGGARRAAGRFVGHPMNRMHWEPSQPEKRQPAVALAHGQAGGAPFGDEPEIITLDKPFMILDLRNRTQGVNIIVADSVEPMNSWAKS